MPLDTARDLFVQELSDTMSVEHIMLEMLGDLASETQVDAVRDAVKHHQGETKQQIKNLQQVFKLLGEKPEETVRHAAEGLKQELVFLKEEHPSPLVLEVGNLAGAAKTEHYEIASYNLLIQMAKDLGETDVADVLKENLDQEKEMARNVESRARQVGKDVRQEVKAQAAAAIEDQLIPSSAMAHASTPEEILRGTGMCHCTGAASDQAAGVPQSGLSGAGEARSMAGVDAKASSGASGEAIRSGEANGVAQLPAAPPLSVASEVVSWATTAPAPANEITRPRPITKRRMRGSPADERLRPG